MNNSEIRTLILSENDYLLVADFAEQRDLSHQEAVSFLIERAVDLFSPLIAKRHALSRVTTKKVRPRTDRKPIEKE